jgi:MFS family permease
MLRADRDFTAFFSARAFGTLGRMSVPFCWGYASTQMELGGSELGQLTAAFTLSHTSAGLLWGLIADRSGFRATFLAALCVWILAVLLLMSSTGYVALVLVFVALGAGMSGFNMSSQNLVLEFGARRNVPMRIAVSNTAADLTGALGFFAGGVLVEVTSHLVLFWTAIGFKSLALLVMLLFVREPRGRRSLPA